MACWPACEPILRPLPDMSNQEQNGQDGQEQQPGLQAEDNKIIAERRVKLAAVREKGVAFPNDFVPRHKAAELAETYGGWTREQLDAEPQQVVLAGRMMLRRDAGKK